MSAPDPRRWPTAAGVLALLFVASPAAAEQLVVNDLVIERFATGVSSPTAIEFLPDGRAVYLEYGGRVRVRPAGGGALISAGQLPTRIMPIEQGGLGLAVDPMFATTNRLYFYYSSTSGTNDNKHRIAWTTLDPGTSRLDTTNLQVILDGIYGPANHNGGGLKFGPDGYLYIGTGDTGCNCGCAPGRADNYFGTCLTNLQGKLLRIDREGGIPASNPLVNVASVRACGAGPRPCNSRSRGPNYPPVDGNTGAPRTEVYNWGFRNAWRFSWDEQTGLLWIGDVGEVTWEEITISSGPGQHHGWPFREGSAGQDGSTCDVYTPGSGPCVDPVYAYNHSESPARGDGSVTGGVFSNHCSWPAAYQGLYWFGGYSKGRIWTLTPNAARDGVEPNSRTLIAQDAGGPVHFANGPDGAIYVADINNDRIYRIAPMNPVACNDDAGTPPAPDATGANPDATGTPTGDTGVPPADSGAAPAADSGAAPAADSGAAATGDTGARPTVPAEDDDCSCATAPTPVGSPLGWLVLMAVTALRRRRR